jgi:hypothetical protein
VGGGMSLSAQCRRMDVCLLCWPLT